MRVKGNPLSFLALVFWGKSACEDYKKKKKKFNLIIFHFFTVANPVDFEERTEAKVYKGWFLTKNILNFIVFLQFPLTHL